MITPLIAHTLDLLNQLKAALSCDDTVAIYAQKSITASVGEHVRHSLDHYHSFLNALEKTTDGTVINYDKRDRCSDCETNPDKALAVLDQIIQSLQQIEKEGSVKADTDLFITCSTHVDDPAQTTRSTLARELQFLHAHTVHHFALIRVAAAYLDVDLGACFGVAPSTLKHPKSAQQVA